LHFDKQAQKNKKKEGEESKDNKVLGFHTIKLLTSSYVIF
jgi:hypothetical protein